VHAAVSQGKALAAGTQIARALFGVMRMGHAQPLQLEVNANHLPVARLKAETPPGMVGTASEVKNSFHEDQNDGGEEINQAIPFAEKRTIEGKERASMMQVTEFARLQWFRKRKSTDIRQEEPLPTCPSRRGDASRQPPCLMSRQSMEESVDALTLKLLPSGIALGMNFLTGLQTHGRPLIGLDRQLTDEAHGFFRFFLHVTLRPKAILRCRDKPCSDYNHASINSPFIRFWRPSEHSPTVTPAVTLCTNIDAYFITP
jgi:hypothetical protein